MLFACGVHNRRTVYNSFVTAVCLRTKGKCQKTCTDCTGAAITCSKKVSSLQNGKLLKTDFRRRAYGTLYRRRVPCRRRSRRRFFFFFFVFHSSTADVHDEIVVGAPRRRCEIVLFCRVSRETHLIGFVKFTARAARNLSSRAPDFHSWRTYANRNDDS